MPIDQFSSQRIFVRQSDSDILLKLHYRDIKERIDQRYRGQFLASDTVEDILKTLFENVYPDRRRKPLIADVQLIRISDPHRCYSFPSDYLGKTLLELKIQDGFTLNFDRLVSPMTSYRQELTVCGPNHQRKTVFWEKNVTTLQMLLDQVIEAFSLEHLDRTRVHLFHYSSELNLFEDSKRFLSDLDFISGTFIDVEIIPPLKPAITSSDNVIVQYSYMGEEHTIEAHDLDTVDEVKEKIEKHLRNRPIAKIDLYREDRRLIPLKKSTIWLSYLGIERGEKIFAELHFDSPSIPSGSADSIKSSLTTNGHEEEKVNVVISRLGCSTEKFQIGTKATLRQLLDQVDRRSTFTTSNTLRIRCGPRAIDLKLRDRPLSELAISGGQTVEVTIIDPITSTTSNNYATHSSLSTMTTTSLNEPSSKPVGLSNVGNTCFMNSALQCLAHAKPLTDYFLNSLILPNADENLISTDQSNTFHQIGLLAGAYAHLLKTIWLKPTAPRSYSSFFTGTSHNPRDIKEIIGNLESRFATYEQQDAQEFMTFFLEQLHKEFTQSNDNGSKKIIEELFYGKIQSIITCLKCQNHMITTNPFNLLSLPLNEQERYFSIQFVRKDGLTEQRAIQIKDHLRVKHLVRDFEKQVGYLHYEITVMGTDGPVDYETPLKDISASELIFYEGEYSSNLYRYDTYDRDRTTRLDECLVTFFGEEHLDDPIECEEHCRERTAAKKQLQLESLPPILIIQLKRFSHENGWKAKIETFVEYPVEGLDLNRFVRSPSKAKAKGENYIYDLFAVSNHIGSIHFGHYTAFTRRGSQWYKCDDSYVSSVVNPRDIVSREAYLLFYIRRDHEK